MVVDVRESADAQTQFLVVPLYHLVALSLRVVLLYHSPLLLRDKDEIFLNGEVGFEDVVIWVFVLGAAEELPSRNQETPVCQVLHVDLAFKKVKR